MSESDEPRANPSEEFDEAEVEDSRQIYLRTWIAGFRALLGWSPEKTLEWAERWADDLRDRSMRFYHGPPEDWMIDALIPEWLKEKFMRDWWENHDPGDHGYLDLRIRLNRAIMRDEHRPHKFAEEYDDRDWAEAKRRVRAVLRDFGAHLPETPS